MLCVLKVCLVSNYFGLYQGNSLSQSILFCILFRTENMGKIHNLKIGTSRFSFKKKLNKEMFAKQECI